MKKALRILLLMATALIIIFTLAACGEDAKSIKNAAINENGELIVTFTDGTTENLGKVTGEDGVNGATPTVAISEDGYWIINGAKTDVKAEGKDGVVVDENPQGLDFYLLPDGTYGVKAGKALYMENIVIPSTYKQIKVTQILQDGFADAYNLKSITIPDSVTSIGTQAFFYCPSLTSVTIPNSVASIGDYAFRSCSSLTSITIPNGVTSIGYGAFYGCSSLTSITIPNSVTSIGDFAFHCCSSLTSITIPNSVTSIGNGAFDECSSLTSVTIPDSVTSIGDYAFYNCTSLTSITIPNNVTSIGFSAFSGCSNLTSISIPFVGDTKDGTGNTHFGYIFGASGYSYNDDYIPTSLKTVTITGGSSIDNGAFSGCSSLTSITISNGVTSIGAFAFHCCSSLTSITIPNSVTSIGYGAFDFCSSLSSITIPFVGATKDGTENTHFGYIFGASGYSYNDDYIPTSLKTVTITGGSTIGSDAFYYCPSLESVVIPDSVTSIGSSAFYGCSSLLSITIPNSVTSIGYGAFNNCSPFGAVHITDITKWCGISFGNSDSNPLGKLYLNGELVTNLVIPEGVTEIKNYAFLGCSSLTSITIPNSVTYIGYGALYGCSSLTNITVGENNTAYKSINGNLYTKDEKTLIRYAPSKSDTYFIVPDSVTSIGYGAFNNCTRLSSITIPFVGATKDGTENTHFEYIFGDKVPGSLKNVTVTGGSSIGESAFAFCSSLTSVNIPDSVTSIGYDAFYWCDSLTSITIPNSVTRINSYAFAYCSNLTDVYYKGTEEEWKAISIGTSNGYLTSANIHYNYTE